MKQISRKGFFGAVAGATAAVAAPAAARETKPAAEVPGSYWRAVARTGASRPEDDWLARDLVWLGDLLEDDPESEFADRLENSLDVFIIMLQEAKPEEYKLLDEMLYQWQNRFGSTHEGNYFRELARELSA